MPAPIRRCLLVLLLALLVVADAPAEVRLPALFGDHMVIQRDKPAVVWGWAPPGAEVTVTLAGNEAAATAADDGRWRVELPAMPTGVGETLTVASGGDTRTFSDVAIGEVWVCSGQSNMQWPLSASNNGDLEAMTADRADIRLISVPGPGSQTPKDDFLGAWEPCTPAAAVQFSAVGYHFGQRLADVLDVPIGLIDNAWGGSAAEAWTPRPLIESEPPLRGIVDTWKAKEAKLDEAAEWAQHEEYMEKWRRRVERAKAAGQRPPEPANHRGDAYGNRRPGNLFNARVAPLIDFPISGVIWYQGESNASRAAEYRDLFPTMIQAWRDAWRQPSMPFYWVQLADFRTETSEPVESQWAELREAQTMTLDRLDNTGQAVIIDIGEASDIHPRNKTEVGNRLARIALARDYDQKVAYASPRFDSMVVEGGKAIVSFKDISQRLKAVDAKQVQGFELAGDNGKFVAAEAKVREDNRVEVSSPTVAKPVAVRYAWADNPVCNLYDATGLPVTPFRYPVPE
ncbi:MAG: sialate O-acetylesterase [Planctomycetota bacterium]